MMLNIYTTQTYSTPDIVQKTTLYMYVFSRKA
jgi:hypothetical protein